MKALDEKTVWVVGAGASKSHSRGTFPTADELLGHMLSRFIADDLPGSTAGLIAFREYCLSRLGANINEPTALPDLETVLGFIDSDMEVSHDASLSLARQFLVQLVRDALSALSRDTPIGSGEYDALVAALGPRDSIISFNWDTLLDDALGRRHITVDQPAYGRASRQYEAFIRDFSGLGSRISPSVSPPTIMSATAAVDGIFLKLHGSIDWFTCTNESCSSKHLVYPLVEDQAFCASCLEGLQSVLVPPVVAKRVRDWAMLRRLWNRAAIDIRSASRIVLWGYSLPATDFYSRWMLSHALTGNLRRLIVINPAISGRGNLVEAQHAAFIYSVRRTFGAALKRCEIELCDSFADWQSTTSPEYPHWHNSIVEYLRAA